MKKQLITILSLAFVTQLSTIVCAADAKPDALGYIRDWLMLAPIPLPGENVGSEFIDKEQLSSEGSIKPSAGDKTKAGDKELTWKAIHSKTNFFDFNELLGSQIESAAGFMVAYVVCEKEMTGLTLTMGSNDQGKVYLNGKEVLKFVETRTLELDSDKVDNVTLKKGVNVVVFKVINETNNWQGGLRFKDKSGKPVTDFTVKLMP